MYFYRKRYAEAETAYQRALMIYEFSTGPLAILLLRASGPEHSKVELVREKYASLLERLHQNEEADEGIHPKKLSP